MMDKSPRPDKLSIAGSVLASGAEDQQSHACTNVDQTHGHANRLHRPPVRNNKSSQVCRFFNSKKGCRAGEQCRYQHVKIAHPSSSAQSGNTTDKADVANVDTACVTPTPQVAQQPVPASRPVSKPVSQQELEDPREFQIRQVVRRYSPFRADLGEATTLKFRLSPTDPDFPFDLETGLHCLLTVPSGYPQHDKATLHVQNAEMAKGFQINVEKGFDTLVNQYPGKSLLALLNELDKNLERFLTSERATTVKFVANAKKEVAPPVEAAKPGIEDVTPVPIFTRYDDAQLQKAKLRRDAEVRQLEARLGRSELFSKAGDGVAFNVPLQVSQPANVSSSLRSLREGALIVPEVYPLEPCTIILRGVEGRDAENVEVAFEKRVVDKPELTLMTHINYLTQNLTKMAVDTKPAANTIRIEEPNEDDGNAVVRGSQNLLGEVRDPFRPHLQYINRPPEWDVQQVADDSDETDSSEYEGETASDEDDIESTIVGASLPMINTSAPEKGIQLSFPGLSMTGIELLHLDSLSITIKCDRCKESMDIKNIKSNNPDDKTIVHRTESCTKCSAPFTVSFNPTLVHQSSIKAGSIEIENCTITNLLPSTFQPTCSQCSTTFPSPPGVIAVRGDSPLTICRTCHNKMTFKIPEVKFLRVSTATSVLPLRSARKPKEDLGISSGTPLPSHGTCSHYSKSYRWFRFSCCARVFPCDKCHDTLLPKDSIHPNEHAERMICGWCSREQRYHPEMCRHCGRSVVNKKITTGFWEGGKGTRDKNLMRKKEGRKFKRSGKEKKEANAKRVAAKGKGGMWWPE